MYAHPIGAQTRRHMNQRDREMLLEQIIADGLNPKKKTVNEYASACPACGGRDRFVIFLGKETYWCRQCEKKGDAIQYLIDFHGMSYPDAAQAVGKELSQDWKTNSKPTDVFNKAVIKNQALKQQPEAWQVKAGECIKFSVEALRDNIEALNWLIKERGITQETAEKFRLGWLDRNFFRKKSDWGLEADGKKMFFPSGLVIPWENKRLRVRRNDPGEYGRYYVVPGSNSAPYLIGTPHETTAIIVESELDAILLAQEITGEIFIIALGSSSIKPDSHLLEKLSFCPVVLVALDTDKAGAKASQWWLENVSNSCRTITPKKYGKDITEAFINGLDLKAWLSACLELYCENSTAGMAANFDKDLI